MFNEISKLCKFVSGEPSLTIHTEPKGKVYIVSAKWACHGKETAAIHLNQINIYSSNGLSKLRNEMHEAIEELNTWYTENYFGKLTVTYTGTAWL